MGETRPEVLGDRVCEERCGEELAEGVRVEELNLRRPGRGARRGARGRRSGGVRGEERVEGLRIECSESYWPVGLAERHATRTGLAERHATRSSVAEKRAQCTQRKISEEVRGEEHDDGVLDGERDDALAEGGCE